MQVNLWVELDSDGGVLRASDGVRHQLFPLFGADLGMSALVRARPDLAAALARRAGYLRVALGHGATLSQFDVEVGQGAQGAHCLLREAPEFDLPSVLGSWAASSGDGVIVADADGHILWSNDRFCALVGYSQGEVTGRYLSVFRSARTGERQLHALTRALVGKGTWSGGMLFRRSDGTELSAWASYTAVREPSRGATTHHVVVISDQTEQEELERLESLDASATLIGRLSRGFAHDINNLAGELVALLEQSRESGALDGAPLEQLERIGGSLGNVGRQLLTLATHGAEPAPADLARVARDLGWLLSRAAARPPAREVEAPGGPGWVAPRADALLRAVLQPARRAANEAPQDAPLYLSDRTDGDEGVPLLRYQAHSTERERLRALLPEGAMVSSTGNSLQTRALAAGVSLSLEVGVAGQVGIRAAVPLARPAAEEPVDVEPAAVERTGRALVVEDNDALQELVTAALKKDFPLTVAASDGLDALETLERVGGRVDVVVLDLMMPRMQGLEFLREARSRWPRLPMIVVSGAASVDQIREARALGAFATLPKPFRVRELRETVMAAVGGE